MALDSYLSICDLASSSLCCLILLKHQTVWNFHLYFLFYNFSPVTSYCDCHMNPYDQIQQWGHFISKSGGHPCMQIVCPDLSGSLRFLLFFLTHWFGSKHKWCLLKAYTSMWYAAFLWGPHMAVFASCQPPSVGFLMVEICPSMFANNTTWVNRTCGTCLV